MREEHAAVIFGAVDIAQHDVRPTLPILLERLTTMAALVLDATGGDNCPHYDGRRAYEIASSMVLEVERLIECEVALVENLSAYSQRV